MKLHAPEFERRLRRGVKRTVRRSPELKREAKRTNRSRHYNSQVLFRIALSAGAGAITWAIAERTDHPATALAFVGVWLMAWLSWLVQTLAGQLYHSPDLSALSLLPITARDIFRWQAQRFLRLTRWVLLDAITMLVTLAWVLDWPVLKMIAVVPIAVLAWLTVVALAGLALVHFPGLPYPLITAAVSLLAFVLLIGNSVLLPLVLALLDRSAGTLRLVLPPNWPLGLFQLLRDGSSWREALFLLPCAALLWTLRTSYARLAAQYQFAEPVQPEAADVPPGATPADVAVPADVPCRVGPTSIAEFVQTRGFLASVPWTGWIEARLWKWFTPRERILAEFVFPQPPEITQQWWKVFRHLAIGLGLGFLLGWLSPALQFWVWCGAMIVPAFRVLGCFYSNGSAFVPIFCSGVNIHLYAAHAIGYRELSLVLFKYSLVQTPLLVAFGTGYGALLAHLANLPVAALTVLAFKATVLLAAMRCIFVTLAFSSGTNDSTQLRSRTVGLIAVVLAVGGLFLGLGAAGLLVRSPAVALGAWFGALPVAWLFWRVYGWFYDANRFDLMNLPKAEA